VAESWRTGRKVGRTVYRQLGYEPSDDDPLIGVMDTPELAALVVEAVNRQARTGALADELEAAARMFEAREKALRARIAGRDEATGRG
jgi:hypothetical protein